MGKMKCSDFILLGFKQLLLCMKISYKVEKSLCLKRRVDCHLANFIRQPLSEVNCQLLKRYDFVDNICDTYLKNFFRIIVYFRLLRCVN
jgi:hypothetical protein